MWPTFPTLPLNTDEQRRLRISLYNPLLRVESGERGRIVDQALAILLGGDTDAVAQYSRYPSLLECRSTSLEVEYLSSLGKSGTPNQIGSDPEQLTAPLLIIQLAPLRSIEHVAKSV